jgi:uncharacterized protein
MVEREVVVRGESTVEAMPDWLLAWVRASGEAVAREEAYAAAARVAAALDAAFAAETGAFAKVQTDSLVVRIKEKQTRSGEWVKTGWTAWRSSRVEIRVLERASELLAGLVGAGGEIAGLRWGVDPDHEAHSRARQEAAREARRQAEDYAAALGLSLGGPAWLAEPGLRGRGGGGDFMGRDASPPPRRAKKDRLATSSRSGPR